MKKYVFILQGDEVLVTMDGKGSNLEKMIKTFEDAGYTSKEVTAKEYREEKQRQEKMMWERDEEILA